MLTIVCLGSTAAAVWSVEHLRNIQPKFCNNLTPLSVYFVSVALQNLLVYIRDPLKQEIIKFLMYCEFGVLRARDRPHMNFSFTEKRGPPFFEKSIMLLCKRRPKQTQSWLRLILLSLQHCNFVNTVLLFLSPLMSDCWNISNALGPFISWRREVNFLGGMSWLSHLECVSTQRANLSEVLVIIWIIVL